MGRISAQGRTNAVRVHRQQAGLTQAELAAACDVARQTVIAVEAGDYAPSVYLAPDLARQLSATVESLFDVDRASLDVDRALLDAAPGGPP